ncbi:MAG: flagellar basal body-associated FliL family protein [Campylobacterales bacterium]
MAEEEKKEEGSGKSKIIIIIIVAILLVLILVIGGALAFFLMSGSHEEEGATAGTPAAEHEVDAKKEKKKHSEELKVGPMVPLDTFIVNLMSDTGMQRYLKTTINLELEPENELMLKEVEAKKPIIRDIILTILTSKTVEEVTTPKGKENLKMEILEKINEKMQDGEFRNVYITEFMIQ